jgi:hypothetical protein
MLRRFQQVADSEDIDGASDERHDDGERDQRLKHHQQLGARRQGCGAGGTPLE